MSKIEDRKSERITIYLSPSQVDFVKRLKQECLKEYGYFPDISQNAWLGMLLETGMNRIANDLTHLREI